MKFSIGLFDELFGERLEVEVPVSDGRVVKRSVTRKWFEKMQAQGRISGKGKPVIQVHMLEVVKGYYVTTWVIGEDISEETVAKFKDISTGVLYAMTSFKDGQPETHVMTKPFWDEARGQLDAI